MNIKKLTALLCAVVMVLSLAACGGSGDKAENKHYTVGICQLVQHDALDAATKGFRDAITDALGARTSPSTSRTPPGDSATCATICNGLRVQWRGPDPRQRDRRPAGCGPPPRRTFRSSARLSRSTALRSASTTSPARSAATSPARPTWPRSISRRP